MQLGKHLVIIQLFQVIREPLVLYSQEAKEGGLSSSLSAHQTEQFLILGAWMEYPADGSQQEVLEHFFHVVALIRPQKVMQAGAYPGLSLIHISARLNLENRHRVKFFVGYLEKSDKR